MGNEKDFADIAFVIAVEFGAWKQCKSSSGEWMQS